MYPAYTVDFAGHVFDVRATRIETQLSTCARTPLRDALTASPTKIDFELDRAPRSASERIPEH
jgi:hypothetical protein